VRSRIYFRKGEGCVYTRCTFCGEFISAQSDGSRNGNLRAKDTVGEALASHCNENHLPEEDEDAS
jgi:hypothetical protein